MNHVPRPIRLMLVLALLVTGVLVNAPGAQAKPDEPQARDEQAAALACAVILTPPWRYRNLDTGQYRVAGKATIVCNLEVDLIFVSALLTRNGSGVASDSSVCLQTSRCEALVSARYSRAVWHVWGQGYVEEPRYVRRFSFSPRRSTCKTL